MTINPPRKLLLFRQEGRKVDFANKLDVIGWKIGGVYEIVNWMELEA
jgi:hypothetical protein